MAYLGNAPTEVPLSSADLQDSIITSAKIADGTIALADLSATGTKDTTTFLRGDNSFATVSSDYVLLASTEASSSASVSFDGYFSSTYKNYKIIGSNINAVNNAVYFNSRLRRSNADITTSDYKHVNSGRYVYSAGGDNWFNQQWNSNFIGLQYSWDLSNNQARPLSFEITLFNPLNTTAHKHGDFMISFVENGATYYINGNGAFWLTDATTALSGITFYFTSGNIASGNFKLYGIK